MLLTFVFNLDPVLVQLGPFTIRYYGLVFVLTLLTAFLFWRRQMLRGGYAAELADRFLIWGAVATVVGARLGHVFFYEPNQFLDDPITIFFIWQGGLASHGATIGLVLALVIFARKNHLRTLEIMDRFTMSAAVGAAGIRLGNFLNSEVVGRVTDVPWGVHFVRYSDHGVNARHPSQLYEFAMGLLVLMALVLADRWAGKEKRPLGLMTGLFFVLYFAGRFIVEFFKEFQPGESRGVLTMGQILSIVPFAAGVVLLVWALRHKEPPQADLKRPKTTKA